MVQARIEYGRVQVLDDVLPPQLYQALLQASRRIGWQFGWNTPSNPNTRYWHHEVGHGRKENTEDVSENVRKHPVQLFSLYQDWVKTHLVPPGTRTLRFYLNAHTYGTDGWPHTDTDRGEELTGVLYLTPEWKPEWCGETVVFDKAGDIEAAVLPRPNRLLVFPSDRLHAPRPLSKAFEGLRVVLVVKLGAPNGQGGFFGAPMTVQASDEERGHLVVLRELLGGTGAPPGRIDHLWATYVLLRQRGEAQDVCLAGLFHGVCPGLHGPERVQEVRQQVRARIGERAESLAWLFGRLRRPQCWSAQPDAWPLREGGTVAVSQQDRRDLQAIERANLDEHGILARDRREGLY